MIALPKLYYLPVEILAVSGERFCFGEGGSLHLSHVTSQP